MPYFIPEITRPYGSYKSHAGMARLLYQADSQEAGLLLVDIINPNLFFAYVAGMGKRRTWPLDHRHTVHGHGKRYPDVGACGYGSGNRGAWSMGSTGSGIGERGGQNGDSALTPSFSS